jgi:hypothetical protein
MLIFEWLPASAKLDDSAAVAFRWTAFGQLLELPHGFVLGCDFQAQLFARLSFAVESLRDRSRAAYFAEQQDFYFKLAARAGDAQHVSDVHFACRLSDLSFRLDPAELASFRRERTRLEEARSPEPFIDTDGGHDLFSYIRTSLHER